MTAELAPAPSRSSLPMALTIGRLIAGPAVAGLILWTETIAFSDRPLAALVFIIAGALFAVAALTDWLDGVLARRLNAVSPLGAALDHVADKVLATCALVALIYQALPLNLVVAAGLLIARDLFMAGLREGLAPTGQALGVSWMGKWKAAATMAGITLLIFEQAALLFVAPNAIYLPLAWGGRALIWAAVALSLVSAWEYATAALTAAKAPSKNSKVFD